MTTNKTTKAVIAAVAIVALVVVGEAARRPKLTTRPEAKAAVVII